MCPVTQGGGRKMREAINHQSGRFLSYFNSNEYWSEAFLYPKLKGLKLSFESRSKFCERTLVTIALVDISAEGNLFPRSTVPVEFIIDQKSQVWIFDLNKLSLSAFEMYYSVHILLKDQEYSRGAQTLLFASQRECPLYFVCT